MKIEEVSPNTLAGSFSNDLIIRKIWAVDELEKIAKKFQTIYILGSWYGNMGFIINKTSSIKYDVMINIDIDSRPLQTSKVVYKKAGIENVRFLRKDVNNLSYQNAGNLNLVINTSVNNMHGSQWFDNIPSGSLVLFQGRNNDPGATNEFHNLSDFKKSFKLSKLLYAGKITLTSNNDDFDSFMIIGIK